MTAPVRAATNPCKCGVLAKAVVAILRRAKSTRRRIAEGSEKGDELPTGEQRSPHRPREPFEQRRALYASAEMARVPQVTGSRCEVVPVDGTMSLSI